MNKEEMILRGIDEIPLFTFNTKTKEFSVLGHKFEGVNSIEDFINYIYNLDKENKQLKEKVKYWVDIYTELKKQIEKEMKSSVKDSYTYNAYKNILDKTKELENSKHEWLSKTKSYV